MKVLLANPPTFERAGGFNRPVRFPTFNYATPVMHPPLFLAYAAGYLRSRGMTVDLLDAQALAWPVEEFLEKAGEFKPDWTVMETSTPSLANDLEVARLLKERAGGKIVLVGAHVSARPEDALGSGWIDAVVRGEYEFSLGELLERGPRGTRGIAYRGNDGEVIVNEARDLIEDLDALPFPARDLLPHDRYFDPILPNPFTYVLAGRGCPYGCSFCGWPQLLTGRKYRHRSVANVMKELREIKRRYDLASFLFNDDTFTVDREWVLDLCGEIARSRLGMRWGCYARADEDDEEILDSLREAGCHILKVGVESGNQAILDRAGKGYRLAAVRRAFPLMLKRHFHVHATFVLGLPGETPQTIEETIKLARDLAPTTAQFSIAVPYPGTEFFRYLEENQYLLTRDWDRYTPLAPVYRYEDLAPDMLTAALRRAYRSHYFRPYYFKVGLGQMFRQPRVFAGNLSKLLKLVRGKGPGGEKG